MRHRAGLEDPQQAGLLLGKAFGSALETNLEDAYVSISTSFTGPNSFGTSQPSFREPKA
jgi:hypothetical protein